jgi:hypothetical protein
VDLLRRFTHISAREESGQRIIKDLLGIDVPIVLDPSLLLQGSDYQNVEVRVNGLSLGDYIFVYNLETSGDFARLVESLTRSVKLPIVLTGYPLTACAHNRFDVGPGEWLWLLRNARYVCTNSFHGVTFSLIFKKQFLAYPRTYSNSRLQNILELANLQDRLHVPELVGHAEARLLSPINYDRIDSMLSVPIEQSRQFLIAAVA